MDSDKLFNVLSAIHPLSDEFRTAIEMELVQLSLPKHYMLLQAPSVSEQVYFLNGGFAVTYTLTAGKKQMEWFWKSGQIILSTKSFFEQLPAREFIQLVTPSDVLCMSYAGVLRLFDMFPEAHVIYRVIMNQYYENSRERIRDMQQLTTKDRYKKLLHAYASIEQLVPQEYIASYLGITPQSLSRMKRLEDRS